MSDLKQPSEYMPALERLRKCNRYAKNWTMRLETKTNKHPSLDGRPWGWYEIFPLGIMVGHWGAGDDLKGVDIKAWNMEAERISSVTNRDK